MVEGETLDKLGIRGSAVLHGHDLDHVEVGLGRGLVDSEDGIDNIGGQALGQAGAKLGRKRCARDGKEELAVDLAGKLEVIEELRQCQEGFTDRRECSVC